MLTSIVNSAKKNTTTEVDALREFSAINSGMLDKIAKGFIKDKASLTTEQQEFLVKTLARMALKVSVILDDNMQVTVQEGIDIKALKVLHLLTSQQLSKAITVEGMKDVRGILKGLEAVRDIFDSMSTDSEVALISSLPTHYEDLSKEMAGICSDLTSIIV